MPLPFGMNSRMEPCAMLPPISAFCRGSPQNGAQEQVFRSVPFWAHFTPDIALIFINNIPEKVGEK
jgi:hypothetical protein